MSTSNALFYELNALHESLSHSVCAQDVPLTKAFAQKQDNLAKYCWGNISPLQRTGYYFNLCRENMSQHQYLAQ